MSDDDKTAKDEPDVDAAVDATEEPEAEAKEESAEKPAEEAGTEEPRTGEPAEEATPAPAANAAQTAGQDQQGRQLYNVKCSNCGKDTQVPFQPSGDRPVYCRDCYMQKKNAQR